VSYQMRDIQIRCVLTSAQGELSEIREDIPIGLEVTYATGKIRDLVHCKLHFDDGAVYVLERWDDKISTAFYRRIE